MGSSNELSPSAEDVMERPSLMAEILVRESERSGGQAPETDDPGIIHYYRLYQGTLIPLYYGENICGRNLHAVEEEYGLDRILGYLLETDGKICFFSMHQGEEPVVLEQGMTISCADLELKVLQIELPQKGIGTEKTVSGKWGRRTHGI